MKTCDIIGISDSRKQWFLPEVMDAIHNGSVFSGGKRHHEIVASLLPKHAIWIDITVPLNHVFEQYEEYDHIVIFASGDPLFYGFANTVQHKCKDVKTRVFPSPNSLQMLAHRMCVPYHDMHVVSLTGRDWQKLDEALIHGETMIGCLTDKVKTPHAIHQRMEEYGYNNYRMTIGENLGNEEREHVSLYNELATYDHPNYIILQKTAQHNTRPFGIPDIEFALLDGREKMITKMPIRLLTLQALDLPRRRVLWDIGACTGSVSIEARLLFPHLHIEAFEIRPECEPIIHENMRRHGAPGIGVHIGDFCSVCCDDIATEKAPDAVFIGGHGGRLKEIMAKVLQYLAPGGIIVMNSVKAPKVTRDSHQLWDEACKELGLTQEPPTRIQLNDYHPITILRCHR
ncbi:MAG: precorrin-6y C5,15-methyltransferase (decarboxylating) subunit CbiE [Bacteroidaceae bacterium]|nr:precorrin-6y C5,15-methyltransferase (decarboxylating) subunit CbiE [Bacteroidaceae bacterium]